MRFDRFASRLAAVAALAFASPFAASQTITDFPVITAGSDPGGITVGSDGNLWFTEFFVGKIGRITTAGVVTEFPAAGLPQLIAPGADGNLWFTETSISKVVRMTPTGVFTDFPLPTSWPGVVSLVSTQVSAVPSPSVSWQACQPAL